MTDDNSYAIFGEGSFAVTERLSLVAGGRYTYEEKEITLCPFTPVIFDSLSFADCPAVLNDSESWGSFAPKLGVNWQATDDVLAYAFWTKGFRSGSFNARAPLASGRPIRILQLVRGQDLLEPRLERHLIHAGNPSFGPPGPSYGDTP